MNDQRYRNLTTQFFVPQWADITCFFQQNGVNCHTACETLMVLHSSFPDRVISYFVNHKWHQRSHTFFCEASWRPRFSPTSPRPTHWRPKLNLCWDFAHRVRVCHQSLGYVTLYLVLICYRNMFYLKLEFCIHFVAPYSSRYGQLEVDESPLNISNQSVYIVYINSVVFHITVSYIFVIAFCFKGFCWTYKTQM